MPQISQIPTRAGVVIQSKLIGKATILELSLSMKVNYQLYSNSDIESYISTISREDSLMIGNKSNPMPQQVSSFFPLISKKEKKPITEKAFNGDKQ